MLTELKQEQGATKTLSEYFYDQLTISTSEVAYYYLQSMPGVGSKTAACILMFNLNRPVMPVDTGIDGKTVGLNISKST
jgi:endonuclease III